MTDSNQPTETPLERSTAPGPSEGGSIFLTVAALCLTGALFVGVVSTQGRFNRIFAEFKTTMPWLTDLVRSPSFAWLAGGLFAVTIAVEFACKRGKWKAVFSIIAVVVALLMAALYMVGMLSPLLRTINLSTR